MQPELSELIRQRLKGGEHLTTIISDLLKRGVASAEIDAALSEVLYEEPLPSSSPTSSASALPIPVPVPPAAQNTGQNYRPTAANAVLIIGVLLIAVATSIVVFSSWSEVGPLMRVLFLVIPLFILFGASAYLEKKTKYEDVQTGLLGTAGVLLPLTIGTALMQFKIVTDLALIFVVSSLIAAVYFGAVEFLRTKARLAPLTTVAAYSFFSSLAVKAHFSDNETYWFMSLVSTAIIGFGYFLYQKNRKEEAISPLVVGTVFFSFFLPFAVLGSLSQPGVDNSNLLAFITSLFGPVYLVMAVGAQKMYARSQGMVFYQIRHALENLAPFVLLFPYLFTFGNNVAFELIGLLISLAYILASIYLPISVLLPLGGFGVLVSLFELSQTVFANSVAWPVLIFLAGFALIGLSLLITRVNHLRLTTVHTAKDFFGLGSPPLQKSETQRFSCLWVILLVTFGPPLILGIFGLFASRLIHNGITDNYSGPTATAPPDYPSYNPPNQDYSNKKVYLTTTNQSVSIFTNQEVVVYPEGEQSLLTYQTPELTPGFTTVNDNGPSLYHRFKISTPGVYSLKYGVGSRCEPGLACSSNLQEFTLKVTVMTSPKSGELRSSPTPASLDFSSAANLKSFTDIEENFSLKYPNDWLNQVAAIDIIPGSTSPVRKLVSPDRNKAVTNGEKVGVADVAITTVLQGINGLPGNENGDNLDVWVQASNGGAKVIANPSVVTVGGARGYLGSYILNPAETVYFLQKNEAVYQIIIENKDLYVQIAIDAQIVNSIVFN